MTQNETLISFHNELIVTEDFNVFKYRNFYNGGGVGIGDFNRDGLPDIYLVSNMGDNQLLINKGNFRFENITQTAGVIGKKPWSTGVSIADVNADGWLDIYLCNAGDVDGGNRKNELFINNKDLTFTERAAEFGLDDNGFTTHAVFFDYDNDNDLDCYVLNNSYRQVASLGYRNLRDVRDDLGGHKLFQNQNGHFVNVSEAAGIYGSVIGFGLGVTVGDVNQDGWPDLYVSNDFYERDYLYINMLNGTFKESIEEYMSHISMFSMGADMGDLNNDGYPEIFTTDMLPQSVERVKTLVSFETYDAYRLRVSNGYYHQFMRNMLHLNNKNGKFLEIGELAGVSATDWSWGSLIADFNSDGFKEIFVANGIYKDVTNQDFVEYLSTNNDQIRQALEGKQVDYKEWVDMMPSNKLSNYLFERESDLRYINNSSRFGLNEPGFSSGAAYGDLDNDGDLDLVINNVNQEVFVYKNQSLENTSNHYLSIEFVGEGKNTFGIGADVKAYTKGQTISQYHMPMRGFQSSMDYKMIMGLGTIDRMDSLEIKWPNARVQKIINLKSNQHITAFEKDAAAIIKNVQSKKSIVLNLVDTQITHRENDYNDFDRDRLQYHMLSTQGPALAYADINNDGYDDVFLGGSVGNPAKIYLQQNDGDFKDLTLPLFEPDTLADHVDAVFFDADNDNDFDLYVVTGGSESVGTSIRYLDKFYRNIGTPKIPVFTMDTNSIPAIYQSGSCVRPHDLDSDGDLDLFIGTRVVPGNYGEPCSQYILINDGLGQFKDRTENFAPDLLQLGMVSDAQWGDFDGDTRIDLLLVGEWMPLTFFKNINGKLVKSQLDFAGKQTEGWWNSILVLDVDQDKDLDFVVANIGLNTKFKPTVKEPINLYVNDFDRNGSSEPIFTVKSGDQEYPMAQRQDIIKQMSSMRKKIIFYRDYVDKTIGDLLNADLIKSARQFRFVENQSVIALNKGGGKFELNPLPIEAQMSPIFAISDFDWNNDSILDLLIGGNLFETKPEVGRYDALRGLLLEGNGDGSFRAIGADKSGLDIAGQIRHIVRLKSGKGQVILFVRNNDTARLLK